MFLADVFLVFLFATYLLMEKKEFLQGADSGGEARTNDTVLAFASFRSLAPEGNAGSLYRGCERG